MVDAAMGVSPLVAECTKCSFWFSHASPCRKGHDMGRPSRYPNVTWYSLRI